MGTTDFLIHHVLPTIGPLKVTLQSSTFRESQGFLIEKGVILTWICPTLGDWILFRNIFPEKCCLLISFMVMNPMVEFKKKHLKKAKNRFPSTSAFWFYHHKNVLKLFWVVGKLSLSLSSLPRKDTYKTEKFPDTVLRREIGRIYRHKVSWNLVQTNKIRMYKTLQHELLSLLSVINRVK